MGAPAVTSWIRKGMLQASKPGRFFVVLREDLLAFLARHRAKPRTRAPDTAERVLAALPRRRRSAAVP